MTAVPLPRQPSRPDAGTVPPSAANAPGAEMRDRLPARTPGGATSGAAPEITPVFALKELVARLNREQHKIQDLYIA